MAAIKTINPQIQSFVSAIGGALQGVKQIADYLPEVEKEIFVENWLQSMWEGLIEPLAAWAGEGARYFLEVYGNGADCNPRSSRVFHPDRAPTHTVRCRAREGRTVVDMISRTDVAVPTEGLPLDRFVTLDGNGWYQEAAPFDHALFYLNGRPIAIPLNQLNFFIESIVSVHGAGEDPHQGKTRTGVDPEDASLGEDPQGEDPHRG